MRISEEEQNLPSTNLLVTLFRRVVRCYEERKGLVVNIVLFIGVFCFGFQTGNMPKVSVLKGERLIRAVRGHTALYDPEDSDYSDIGAKAKLWSEVALQCNINTGLEAKLMWKNLRDCYRICRNKLCTNPNSKMWQFYDNMTFLEPYIKNRKSIGCPSDLRRNFTSVQNHESEKDTTKSPIVSAQPQEDFTDANNTTRGEFATIQYWTDAEEPAVNTTVVVSQVGQTFVPHSLSTLDSEHESYEDILPEELKNGSVENSLKMFFDAMYASTSQLPPKLQRSVKNKIFTAILQAEDEAESLKKVNETIVKTEI